MWCVLLLALITTTALTSFARTAPPQDGSGAYPTPRITQEINPHAYITLPGNTRPEADNAVFYKGPASAAMPIDHILLFLQRSPEQELALQEYITSLNDRKSSNFHKWLTPDELGSTYGVDDQDIQKITSWLESQGFVINQVYPNKMLIDFSGTAGTIKTAFHTEIGKLVVNGQDHLANMTDPQIPAAFAPVIKGFFSLNDFPPHAMHKSVTQYTFAGCASSSTAPTEPGTCYAMTPQDNQTIYNLTPLYNAGYSGQGQTIYLIEDTDSYGSDWQTYRTTFGLSTAFPQGSLTTTHPGGCTDPGTNADDGEANIDIEVATAVAPSATINLASCPSGTFSFGGLIALQNLINESSPTLGVVSVSYGLCEAVTGNGGNAAFYNTYQQAAAEGFSVFVSSGDEGQSSCSAAFGTEYAITSLGVTGWGSSPYNVSVGGTDFEDTYNSKTGQNGGLPLSTYWNSTNAANYGSAKSYIPEIPWNDSCASALISEVAHGTFLTYGSTGTCNTSPFNTTSSYISSGAGSGGASNCATGAGGANTTAALLSEPQCQGWAKPSYQTGAALSGGQAVYGMPSDGVRDIPDVSMFAANGVWGHFETVCWSDPTQTSGGATSCSGAPSTWSGFGGTSVASPTMAAIQALVNQKTGETWGNPNPIYYQIAQNEYGTAGNFLGASCNSSGTGGPGSGCVFNDVTQGDIDLPCEYNGTAAEHHCFPGGVNPGTSGVYGVASTDNVTGATVINGGTGYTTAPTCTIAGPSNNNAYLSPTGSTLYAGGTQATCTAAVTAGSQTAVWTVKIASTSAAGQQIALTNNSGTTICGPYTLTSGSTTAIATALASSLTSSCSTFVTNSRTTSTVTITSKTAGYAGNFITGFYGIQYFGPAYVTITNTTKGQGPNYVSAITVTAAGSGYQPETPITLTGGGGSNAVAVANTTPGTPAQSYQPAWGAGPGYDMATGLGSVNAYNLVYASIWGPSQVPCPISFTNPGTQTYGVAPFGLTATDSPCNLPITFSVVSGPATVAGNSVTITGAGSVTLQATQPGNSNYLPDTEQVTFSVNKAMLTVTATSTMMTYGGSLPVLSYSMTGFVNGDNQGNSTTGAPSITTGATSSSPVGNYAINAAQGTLASTNYTFAFVNGVLAINPAVLTVTANNQTMSEGGNFPTFTYTMTGFVNGDSQGTATTGQPSITTDAPNNPPVGTYNIIPSLGTLAATNYTFAFVNGTLTVNAAVAQLTSPVNNSQLGDTTVTFVWTHETGATAYQVWVGATPGGQEYGYCGTTGLTCTLSGLPSNGSTVYATLYGYANNTWSIQDSGQYTAVTVTNAQITSPPKGSTLAGTAVTFTWTAESGATAYQVWAGTTPGADDLGYCGSSDLSCTISGLPSNGQPIYVTLYGLSTSWTVQDTASYNAGSAAQITAPTKGSTLTGSAATFTWTSESGATSYQLWIGSTPGANDIDYGGTSAQTISFSNLPTNGQTLYVTLYGYAGGVWTVQDTATYTAATVANAQIVDPPPGSTLSGDTVTFTWTPESGATSYQLWVGSAPGQDDLGVGGTTGTSTTMSNLPTDGSQVYVTLYGYASDTWTVQDQESYTASGGHPQIKVNPPAKRQH